MLHIAVPRVPSHIVYPFTFYKDREVVNGFNFFPALFALVSSLNPFSIVDMSVAGSVSGAASVAAGSSIKTPMPMAPEEARKRQRHLAEKTAIAQDRVDLAELREEVVAACEDAQQTTEQLIVTL